MSHDPAAVALGGGAPQRVGRFGYDCVDGSWWWSATFFEILGFAPGDLVPSAEALAAHWHPDDEPKGIDQAMAALLDGAPFACLGRVVDAHQRTLTVLLSFHGERDSTGAVVQVTGHLTDLTDARRHASLEDVEDAVAHARASIGTIERVKGMLMMALGVDDDAAFALLSECSQDSNWKVRELCRALVDQFEQWSWTSPETQAEIRGIVHRLKSRASQVSDSGSPTE